QTCALPISSGRVSSPPGVSPDTWSTSGAPDVLHVSGDTPGVDETLPLGVTIRGHVSGPAGEPVAHLGFSAQQSSGPCCQFVAGAQTDDAGNYVLIVPQGAQVKIEFGVFNGPPPG